MNFVFLFFFTALLQLVIQGNCAVVELTASNFDENVFGSGSSSFIKFFAPVSYHFNVKFSGVDIVSN